jgi:phosphoserine phosphatase
MLECVRWRPYAVALFDCDSTLSAIEGIDELPADDDCQQQVAALTEAAMDGETPLEDVYGQRLSILSPTKTDIGKVKTRYKSAAVPDVKAVIAALHHAQTETWIVSGGLLDPVAEFAVWLGVPPDRVRAVATEFDPLAGQWWNGDDPTYAAHDAGHLTTTSGKADVIRNSVTNTGRKLMVGDGVSDLAAADEVDLFVAYAGVVSRPAVVDNAPVVINSHSMAPVLALILGPNRVRELVGGQHDSVASKCLSLIDDGALRFNDATLEQRFSSC